MQASISSFFKKKPTSLSKKLEPPSSKEISKEVISLDSDDEVETVEAKSQSVVEFAPSERRQSRFKSAISSAFDGVVKASQQGTSSSDGSSSRNSGSAAKKKTASKKKIGKGDTYTPLEKQVVQLKEKHPDAVLMVECGYRMRFFGEDATNAAKVLSIHSHKDHNFMVASVPTHRFLVHARRLIAAGYRVGLVRQTETAAIHSKTKSSSKTFDRSCVGLYTPGTDIDEDDPAFADMISLSKKREPSEEDEVDDDDDDNDDHSAALGEPAADTGVEPLLAVVVDDKSASTTAVVSIQLRASVVTHRVLVGSALAREQETMDYLDMLRPVEVVTDTNMSPSLWNALLQRCKGVISMERETEGSGQASSPTVAALPGAFVIRLNRVAAHMDASNAALIENSWSKTEALAFVALQRYLACLLHSVALPDVRLTDDNPRPNPPRPGVDETPQGKVPASLAPSYTGYSRDSMDDDRRFRLDPVTARDLEVFSADTSLAPAAGASMPSLLQEMNHCRSAFGRRTLRSWLGAPLTSAAGIQRRQRAVTWLLGVMQEGGSGKTRGMSGRGKTGGTGSGAMAPAPASGRIQWLGAVERALGGGSSNVERWLSALKGGKLSPSNLASLLQWASRLHDLAPSASAISAHTTSGASNSSIDTVPDVVMASLRPETLSGAAQEASRLLDLLSADATVDWKAASDGSVLAFLGEGMLVPFEDLRAKRAELAEHEGIMQEHLHGIRRLLHQPALQFRTLNTGGGSSIEHLIEVDAKDVAANGNLVPSDWVPMNSTKAVLRYHPPQVLQTQQKLVLARDETASAARAAWRQFLLEQVAPALSAALHEVVRGLGVVDCLLSLARLASRPGYTCPQYAEPQGDGSGESSSSSSHSFLALDTISLTQARHPVAERLMELGGEGQFQPNDVTLRCNFRDRSCLVITGPNMGGKSTYVRMVSVICLMGQIGSYVPAASAHLPVLDNIFTRMGVGDDLAAGRSTFATELFRTNSILERATARSLVVLDELGRGTSTNDGVCIAMASLRYFVEKVGCAMFFVTHYAQISDSVREGQSLSQDTGLKGKACNVHMGYLQDEGKGKEGEPPTVLFLFQAVEGASEGSYGLNVARLAGLDQELLKIAEEKSEWMRQKMSSHATPALAAQGDGGDGGENQESATRKRRRSTDIDGQKEETNDNMIDTVNNDGDDKNVRQKEEEKRKLQRLIADSQRKLEQLSDNTDGDKDNEWKAHVIAGRIKEATSQLGQYPSLTGIVVHGEKRGRTIGYPTANLGVDFSRADNVIPSDGVYAGWLTVSNNKLRAAISIGTNPTFEGERSRQVEAFALRQASWIDLYDQPATVTFKERLRDTVKYEGANWLEQLLEQMGKDCDLAWDLTEE